MTATQTFLNHGPYRRRTTSQEFSTRCPVSWSEEHELPETVSRSFSPLDQDGYVRDRFTRSFLHTTSRSRWRKVTETPSAAWSFFIYRRRAKMANLHLIYGRRPSDFSRGH